MVSPVNDIDGAAARAADRLLEDSWDGRGTQLSTRELAAELSITAVFVLVAGLFAHLAPSTHTTNWPLVGTLVLAFALVSRVEFPVGAGVAVPTQLFLVPMLVLAPPGDVPLLVAAGLATATIVDAVLGRARIERLVETGGDAWHALGPALVFVIVGGPDATDVAWWVFGAALAAQIVAEVTSATVREWLALGIPPNLQLRVLATVWLIDVLLTPAAIAVTFAASGILTVWAPLAMLGIIGVLAMLARDRNTRIEQAHARLEALHRERRRLQIAVYRIGDAFASKLDFDALLTITTRAAVEALDAEGGRASSAGPEGAGLTRRAVVHPPRELELVLRSAEEASLMNGGLAAAEVDGRYALACPLLEHGVDDPHGMIVVGRAEREFSVEERDLLQHLCEQAAVAAGNIERHEALHRQALTDELTGLANHRRLQELLAAGAERFHADGTQLALLLFDLDRFKRVNDTHGHQTGDRVLAAVAQTLRENARAQDEPARYGGEELAIAVPGASLDEALQLAERIRADVEALQLLDPQGNHLPISTSVGVAEMNARVTDKQQLIAAADQALYRAKHGGRNRVCGPQDPAELQEVA